MDGGREGGRTEGGRGREVMCRVSTLYLIACNSKLILMKDKGHRGKTTFLR